MLVDEPAHGRPLSGPPAGYLALIGIASCTIVTVAGVASRGESKLQGMRVGFDVETVPNGPPTIRQRTVMEATPTERDRLRLTRAVSFCPVGKNFTKHGLEIDDDIQIVTSDLSQQASEVTARPIAMRPVSFVDGTVMAEYLTSTQEWAVVGGRRVLVQEGEVKLHVDCAGEAGTGQRWGYLGGHSGAGWAPRPSAYAMGSLAASSVITLRADAARLGITPATLRVEVEASSPIPVGGKEASQDEAAEGRAGHVVWIRRVTFDSPGGRASKDAVLDTMRSDPIYGYCRRADLLAHDEIAIQQPLPRPTVGRAS